MLWITEIFQARTNELHQAFQKILKESADPDVKMIADLDLKDAPRMYRRAWMEVAACESKRFNDYIAEHEKIVADLKRENNKIREKLAKENRDMAKQCVQAMEELMTGIMNEKTFWSAIEDARVKIDAMQWAIE